MANVLKAPEHVAKLGYNGFPMQQYLKFSSTVGELLPVYYDILYPGDKVTGHVEHRTRTMPLETAAMCHIEEHFDWFAVPLDQIFSLSSALLSGVRDIHSTIIENQIIGREVNELCLPFTNGEVFTTAFNNARNNPDYYFPVPVEGHEIVDLLGTPLRLLELLGTPLNNYSEVNDNHYPFAYALMWLAAYQKIYYDYFRLSDREVNEPSFYNLDDCIVSGGFVSDPARVEKMMRLHYRAAGADFMTHNYVSPLFGMASDQGFGSQFGDTMNIGEMFHQWLVPTDLRSRGVVNNVDEQSMSQQSFDDVAPSTVTNNSASQNILGGVSPAALTTTFAARKFLEITRRSAKHLDAQTLAHFGVKVDKRVSGEVIHLGHSKSSIVIGDVISTAQTAEGALGQVGGKGYNAATSGKISYTNNEACPVVLMCIYSAAPIYDYRVVGADRLTTLISPSELFRPEFDNLGMQPLFAYQSLLGYGDGSSTYNYGVIGWQYRWMELKCKQNRVCGSLARSLNNWTTFRDVVSASLRSRLVSPWDIDSIMVKHYDFDASYDDAAADNPVLSPMEFNGGTSVGRDPFDSDPLIHECYFDVKKASKMSAYGLESL